MAVAPSPVVALNRAVTVAEVDAPEAGLALVDDLDLQRYHLFHAIRADLLRRAGRGAEAASAYEAAIGLTEMKRSGAETSSSAAAASWAPPDVRWSVRWTMRPRARAARGAALRAAPARPTAAPAASP